MKWTSETIDTVRKYKPYMAAYIERFGKKTDDGSYDVDLIIKYPIEPNIDTEEIYKEALEKNVPWRKIFNQNPWNGKDII